MRGSRDYRRQLNTELSGLIEALALPALPKQMLRARWLDQLLWRESRADAARDWYYRLRLTTIIGGVLLPALVSVGEVKGFPGATRWVAFGLSLLIAISAAIEEFFHFGERWRSYRETVERLKSEGWQFLQLGGQYRRARTHTDALPLFTARVEEIIQREVEHYVTSVAAEQHEEAKPAGEAPAVKGEGDVAHGVS